MKTSELGKFVSISLNYNLENKTGAALAGQIFKNLREMASTKLHRLGYATFTLFYGAKWIDSKTVCTQLLNKIKNLTSEVKKVRIENKGEALISATLKDIQNEISQMKEVCNLLKKNKLMNNNVKNLETQLGELNDTILQLLKPKEEIKILTEETSAQVTEEHREPPASIEKHRETSTEVTVKHEEKPVEKLDIKEEAQSSAISCVSCFEELKEFAKELREEIPSEKIGEQPKASLEEIKENPIETRFAIIKRLKNFIQIAYNYGRGDLEEGLKKLNKSKNTWLRGVQKEDFNNMKPEEIREKVKSAIDLVKQGFIKGLPEVLSKIIAGLEVDLKKPLEEPKKTLPRYMKYIETELNTIIHEANVYRQDKKLEKIQEESHNFRKMTFTDVQRNVADAIKLIQEDFRKVDIELCDLPVSLKARMLHLVEEIVDKDVGL